MPKKVFILTALLTGLGTFLYGQTTPTFVFSPGTLPDGLYGSPYSNQSLMVTGGTAPYTFSVSGGNLPPGLSLSTDGVLSGTPTAAGTYSFTITALDNSPAPGPYSGGQAYTLIIDQAALTITANPAGSIYGAALVSAGSLTVNYSSFVNGDGPGSLATLPTVTNAAIAGAPVGNYALVPSGAASNNYNINYTDGIYSISPAPLSITAVNQSMTYGGTVPSLTANYSGFVNGDGSGSLTTPPTVTTSANSSSQAGAYPIAVSGAVDPNYTITYFSGTLTIGKANLIVTAADKPMPLGGPLPTLTVSYSGFAGGENASNLTTQPTVTTTATATSPAGTYAITPGGGSSPNYTFSYVNGTLSIGKAILTITANASGSVYGAVLVPGSSLTVSYSGFVNGDGPASLTRQPTVSNAAYAGAPAGSYALVPSGAQSNNYIFSYVNGTYTIGPAALSMTAANQSMTYGGPLPPLTATYSGFVNGDGPGGLTTQPQVTTTGNSSSPAGTYPISVSGAANPNYSITYHAGTLTVGKANLTVSADNKTMPLGGPLPTLTVSYSGFVKGDNAASLTTHPSLSVSATATSPAGSYPISVFGAASPNYTFTYVTGILAIGKALLTITVKPAGSVYGAALVPTGSLTVTYSGFVNGDGPGSLTAQPIITNTAIAGAPVGSYALIASGAQSDNYAIGYVNGVYTISPAPLNITAVNQTMTYGGPVPALTASYSGFVNGDNASRLNTAPAITTSATISSPTGTYPITVSGAVDPNYTISYNPGTMTVQRAALTITPNSASSTYGGALPALTVSYSGFVNGDNASKLTTQPSLVTTATSSSPAGTYPITASGAASPNYNFVYNTGTLTIGAATLHVTALAQTKEFGAPDPAFTYTATGFVSGDNSNVFTGSLSRTPGENVGTYLITAGSLSAGTNYTIDFTGNKLTITIAGQHITWVQSLIVGCNNQTRVLLTATASSDLPVTFTVSGSTVATVSGDTLTLLEPGTTVVTATQAGNANYSAAPAVTDTVYYQAASLIRQRWSDAIFFDNSSGDYVQWQWYKNGNAVAGSTTPYYSETPSLNGQYYVVATNKDGQKVQSCTLDIATGAAVPGGIKVYPNPVNAGAMSTITCNYTSTALQGATLSVLDLAGRVLQLITTVQPTMQVVMPSQTGTYIVNLLLANGQKASVNVLVMQ